VLIREWRQAWDADLCARGAQVSVASGDFFADPLPKADVVTMGLILHDWNLERSCP